MAENKIATIDAETLENSSSWDVGAIIHRTNALPLDSTSYFTSYSNAERYAKGEFVNKFQNGATAFVGQILTVVENGNVSSYQIVNSNGDLVKLVFENNSSDIKNDVTIIKDKINNLTDSLSNIQDIKNASSIFEIKDIISEIVNILKDFSN